MKRKGAVPPIVTVLVVIASIVGASLVAWFLWTSTRTATSTPILEVTDAYYVGSGSNWRITFTLRNLGSTSVQLSASSPAIQVFCDGFSNWVANGTSGVSVRCGSTNLASGLSVSCTISGTGAPSISPVGDALNCQVQFPAAGVTVAFKAYKP